MRKSLVLIIALSGCAGRPVVAGRTKSPVDACVKWSKDLPAAAAAGERLFASFRRVDGAGPHHGCAVVTVNENFGVGWLMSAYMKQTVFSPCGKRLGAYSFRYKGEEWQESLVVGLHDFVLKNPAAADAAKECPAPEPAPAPAPVPAPPSLDPPAWQPPTEPTATP